MKKPVLTSTILGSLVLILGALNLFQYLSTRLSTNQASTQSLSSQAQVLCDYAKDHLKEYWTDHNKNIEQVIHVVNSPYEMEAKFKADIDEIAKSLSLDDSARAAFAPKYKIIFDEHVGQFRKFLNQSPEPNKTGMFQTLKTFYAAEDKLILTTFGPKSLEKFRESQAIKRTPMLAVVAQYAGLSWDQNITW